MLSTSERSELVQWRRTMHSSPELAFDEYGTAAWVEELLGRWGYSTERVGETGVITLLDTGRPGRTVLLRADMDGLPIQEENEHSYRSTKDGVMHACGHDGHTASLLMVAKKMAEDSSELNGRVLFVFQPAEEGAGGALQMIESGLLERFQPDCCAGIHLWSEHPTGTVSVHEGPFMASMDTFEVTVRGKGGHGAVPQSARDPLVAAAQMVVSLQNITARQIDPEQSCVLTVGQLHSGHAVNIIPDTASFSGSVRTFDVVVQERIKAAFYRLIEGVAAANAVDAEIEYTRTTIPTVNDPRWCAVMRDAASGVEGATLGDPGFRTMASEDMAFFLERCPGVFIFVGAGNDAVGASFPHHHPRFEIDEAALPVCVSLLYEFTKRAATLT